MITFDDVSLNYDARHTALSNINIHIDKGEFVFIVGPSGAGKSTFVKILTHELVPETGSVIVNNIKINKLKPSKVPYYRRSLGIVFQDFRLLSEKTVFENIAFVLRVTGTKSKDIKERVNKVLDLVGLRGKEKELPSKLSGGEQQRVAIARALVNQPTLLIADEPTGNLDSKNSHEIVELLKRMNREYNQTLIMITHDESIALQARRIIAIEDGKIVRDEVISK